jgi:PAS domain S-box-containing protein
MERENLLLSDRFCLGIAEQVRIESMVAISISTFLPTPQERVETRTCHLDLHMSSQPSDFDPSLVAGVVRALDQPPLEGAAVHSILDAVPALVSYVDKEYRYRLCNLAYTTWFGLKREDVLGRTAREVLGEDAWKVVGPHMQVALQGTRAEFEREVNYRFGGRRWIHGSYIPQRDEHGQVQGIVVLVNEITESKDAEMALRREKERAESASRAKDAFLAQLSHELRTPLTPVLMTVASLKDDHALPEYAREQLADVERNVLLESRLIDDLLDLTRITAGKLRLREERCNVRFLLLSAVELVRDDAQQKGLRLQVELTHASNRIRGDSSRLQQVFWNLIQNAVKFTPTGGTITVTSSLLHGEDGSEPRLRVEVRDDGIGFDPEVASSLFEPFQRGHIANDHRFPGLGLGLAIVKAVVDLHDGSIAAHSDGMNHGATFTLELPACVPPAESDTASSQAETGDAFDGKSASLKLLLVEDHEPTRRVLSLLLARAGHEVVPATCVSEALNIAATQSFHGVISDLGLPDGHGAELMSKLRERHGLRGIAMSGYGTEEDVQRSHDAGFVAHLIKPVTSQEVRRALSHFLKCLPAMTACF